MEELKLIVDLLKDVGDNTLYGIAIYFILDFFKIPVIIGTIGYCINVLAKNVKIETIEEKPKKG